MAGFMRGNDAWKKRSTHGNNPKFSDPDVLWSACCEYFKWAEETPLKKAEPFKIGEKVRLTGVPKLRAVSIHGLCVFLDIARSTWDRYRKAKELADVTSRVESIIRTQKFEAAAANMLHPVIISRDLRLGERETDGTDEAKEAEVKKHAGEFDGIFLDGHAAGGEKGGA